MLLLFFSEKYTRFCQWKNLELNIQVSIIYILLMCLWASSVRPGNKNLAFLQTILSNVFEWKKFIVLWLNFNWNFIFWIQLTIWISSGNGLVSSKWQAITWTNYDIVHWEIFLSSGLGLSSFPHTRLHLQELILYFLNVLNFMKNSFKIVSIQTKILFNWKQFEISTILNIPRWRSPFNQLD